ncbi:hypothetical protein F5148DRAFT_348428 [Russula earlei]|uniref:Uncharacterized protein n=1 Tax=Russula earlei TaxID=71964 RepID=A0ACC0U153_9AGAM|nr:hypothetical protein F5148DRAFT_348428 [Russula earlei]
MLLPRLAKWTGVVTSDFFSVGHEERSGADHAPLFHSIIDILASAHDAGLHLPTIDDDGKDDDNDVRDQQAALVCVATHCLSSPLFPIISASHRRAALALLRDVVPRSTTFDAIAGQPLARSRVLAGALRAHNLGSLERAFWACAVKHSSPSSRVDPELRRALDDASERGRTKTGASRRQMRRAGSARSPPRKRARRDIPRRRLPSPSPSSSSSSSSSSTSMSSTPSLLSSSSSWSARSLSGCETPGEMACCPSEDEERTGRSCTAMGSCGDFRSVLADALKMRKDLKAERRRDSLRAPCSCDRSESLESGYSREEENAAATLPSEGDVLDMFAYDDPV